MKVFISYRRSDTQDLAGRIGDRLKDTPGIDGVFVDVDGIEPGADFDLRIRNALTASRVCLVVMGDDWSGKSSGDDRLQDPADFVRREVELALQSKPRILPVLANGARMPASTSLPPSLAPIAALNAVTLSHLSFERDFEDLASAILSGKRAGRRQVFRRRRPIVAALLRAIVGLCLATVLVVAAAAVHMHATGLSLDQRFGGAGPMWLANAAILALGALAGVLKK